MAKVPLGMARPGMVLAKPVFRGDSGMVLVAEGTELTPGILATLERMEVGSLVVKGEVEGLPGSISVTERLQRLDHLFRSHEDDPWMEQVKGFLKAHFQENLGGAASGSPATGKD
ncbi:MAG: hypothetical protein ACOCVU_07365 [Desulfohalobiaceae bacterium]